MASGLSVRPASRLPPPASHSRPPESSPPVGRSHELLHDRKNTVDGERECCGRQGSGKNHPRIGESKTCDDRLTQTSSADKRGESCRSHGNNRGSTDPGHDYWCREGKTHPQQTLRWRGAKGLDRKSTRLNSSHPSIS